MKKFFILIVLSIVSFSEDYSFLKPDINEYFKVGSFYYLRNKDAKDFNIEKDKALFNQILRDKKAMEALGKSGSARITGEEAPNLSETILGKNDDNIRRILPILCANIFFDHKYVEKDISLKLMNNVGPNEKLQLMEGIFTTRGAFHNNQELYLFVINNCNFFIDHLKNASIDNVIRMKKSEGKFIENTLLINKLMPSLSFLNDYDCIFYFRKIIGGFLYYSESLEMPLLSC